MSILLQFFAPSFWTKLRRLKSPKRRPPLAPTLVWLAGMYGGQNVTSLGKKRICCFKSLQTRRSILFEGSKRLILRIRLENTSPLQLCFNQPVQPTRVLLNFHPTSIFFHLPFFFSWFFLQRFIFRGCFTTQKIEGCFLFPPRLDGSWGNGQRNAKALCLLLYHGIWGIVARGVLLLFFFVGGRREHEKQRVFLES